MSVYKHKNSPYYQYDFQVGGVRFHGSTGSTNKRDAEGIERQKREAAKVAAKAAKHSGGGPLTIDVAAERYWLEVGELHTNARTTFSDLGRLVEYFGPSKLLSEITDEDVAAMVRWRRGHRKNGRELDRHGEPTPFVSAATVNRSTTEVLKKLFTRAKRTWRHTFPIEPNWADHMLGEPAELERELKRDESAALKLATRSDYEPIFAFVRATGLRQRENLLRWSQVDWDAGVISTIGKKRLPVKVTITPTIRAILEPLVGHHPVWVFTFVAERSRDGRIQGQRYPITRHGLISQWRRLREKSGVENFRFHDFRHDVGTKLLRQTGNLKLVQKALNHRDIKTTTRYAHVLDEEVGAAMQALAERQADTKSRKKSRKAVANE